MTDLASESLTNIVPALIAAQSTFAPAVKDTVNPAFRSKYVSLDGVLAAVETPLRANGIAIVQQTYITDAGTELLTRLIHTSGEWLGSRYPVHPVKSDPQGEGSALTYARRYALMALVGIAPEDDDGNAASASERPAQARPPRPSKPAEKVEPPADLLAMIAAASTVADLAAAGTQIATADIPGPAKAELRTQYNARMADLKAAS